MNDKISQSGQVLLITLLVLSIATTIVLSLIGRTTTDVAISNQIAESSRAFSAAEAGIEEALKTGVGSGAQVLSPGVSYSVQTFGIGGVAGVYQFLNRTPVGSAETVWLVNHGTDGTLVETPTFTSSFLDVCWTSETTTPAVLVSIFYKTSGGSYRVARGAYDPNATRAAANKFSGVTGTSGCGSGTTTYRQTISFASFTPVINPASDTLLALRLQPVYSDTAFAVSASTALPLQGSKIESVGTSGTGVTRKIIVFQSYHAPSSLFDSVIYSEGSFSR